MDIVGLIVQLVSGAVGGNVAGAALKKHSLGPLWNSVVGIVGGGIGGQILTAVLGGAGMEGAAAATAGGGLDIGSIIGSVAGGGVGGAILMIIVGIIRKAMTKTA